MSNKSLRLWLVRFWRGKQLNTRQEIGRERVHAINGTAAKALCADKAPPGTDLVTAARYRKNAPAPVRLGLGLADFIRNAAVGDVIWVDVSQNDVGIYASRAGREVRTTSFVALNTRQFVTGELHSACETVKLTRITVLGTREEAAKPAIDPQKAVIYER